MSIHLSALPFLATSSSANFLSPSKLITQMDVPEYAANFPRTEMALPLKGFRQYVAFTYLGCNLLGLLANSWVLFVVGPLLWVPNVRVPKSILFHILALCVSDLATMCAMVLLNLEIFCGTWRFGSLACTAYLLFDSMNKFSAPIIVLLISRTCYATVCLDKKRQQRAASLKLASLQVLVALSIVLVLLWPLFAYSQVSSIPLRIDNHTQQILFIRKCAFVPPPSVESLFNIVVCIASYAIPFAGFLYWYASVPFFLWRKKEHLLAQNVSVSSSRSVPPSGSAPSAKLPFASAAVIRRVVLTVLVLAMVYLVCWTPYWIGMFAQRLLYDRMTIKHGVITMYFVHLMPYVSCAAYPAIFTLFNRPIRSAHSQWRRSMQRRLQRSTLARRIRDAIGSSETAVHNSGTTGTRKDSHQQGRKRSGVSREEERRGRERRSGRGAHHQMEWSSSSSSNWEEGEKEKVCSCSPAPNGHAPGNTPPGEPQQDRETEEQLLQGQEGEEGGEENDVIL